MTSRNDRQNRLSGSVNGFVDAPPGDVFALVTDIDRLPEWNDAVTRVIERPARLTPRAEWVVTVKPAGWPAWPSRSWVEEIDPRRRVFRHGSQSDDGNPSYAEWRWQVDEEAGGSRVTISWELHPETFWRKLLAAPLRQRRLARAEVPGSLTALARYFASR
jgi:uncharacterized protein YndB with AHSA1/START domain